LAAWACRLGDELPPSIVVGALIETLVVNEIVTQAAWTPGEVVVRHWRDTARHVEVDAVLVTGAASVPIEVKAARDIRPDDLAGLRHYLANIAGATFGVIFYSGSMLLEVDDGIWAVPISALWSSE
jgi:predicted AAA+ superfamily ATPase